MSMRNDWEMCYKNLSLEYVSLPTIKYMNLTQLKIVLDVNPLLLVKVLLLSWDKG